MASDGQDDPTAADDSETEGVWGGSKDADDDPADTCDTSKQDTAPSQTAASAPPRSFPPPPAAPPPPPPAARFQGVTGLKWFPPPPRVQTPSMPSMNAAAPVTSSLNQQAHAPQSQSSWSSAPGATHKAQGSTPCSSKAGFTKLANGGYKPDVTARELVSGPIETIPQNRLEDLRGHLRLLLEAESERPPTPITASYEPLSARLKLGIAQVTRTSEGRSGLLRPCCCPLHGVMGQQQLRIYKPSGSLRKPRWVKRQSCTCGNYRIPRTASRVSSRMAERSLSCGKSCSQARKR